MFNELKSRAAGAPQQPNIRWLGFRQDVANILRQADIFLLPSVSEGFSISTVEAMMAGVPVIATRSGGPEEIIDNGVSGTLVPVRDPLAIVDAIQKMMDQSARSAVVVEARGSLKSAFPCYPCWRVIKVSISNWLIRKGWIKDVQIPGIYQ